MISFVHYRVEATRLDSVSNSLLSLSRPIDLLYFDADIFHFPNPLRCKKKKKKKTTIKSDNVVMQYVTSFYTLQEIKLIVSSSFLPFLQEKEKKIQLYIYIYTQSSKGEKKVNRRENYGME